MTTMMKRQQTRGAALMEYALMVPLLFLLVVNVVNFGGLFFAWIAVTAATRSAGQFVVTGPAYLGYSSANGLTDAATSAQITNLITSCPGGDLCTMPNQPSITVTVCTNKSTAGSPVQQAPFNCNPGTDPSTGATFADPEPGSSVLTTVNVSYRYCPFVSFFDIPTLNIHSTLTPCSSNDTAGGVVVQRTAVMRIIQ